MVLLMNWNETSRGADILSTALARFPSVIVYGSRHRGVEKRLVGNYTEVEFASWAKIEMRQYNGQGRVSCEMTFIIGTQVIEPRRNEERFLNWWNIFSSHTLIKIYTQDTHIHTAFKMCVCARVVALYNLKIPQYIDRVPLLCVCTYVRDIPEW